jgi:hypothetical protein
MRWFIWRSSNSLQPGLLDCLDLFSNHHEARQVTADLG